VDVYASNNTELVIDINGYFTAQTGITLALGTATTPSLSFAGDGSTGVFSSGVGYLNLATGGTTRLTVRSDGDLDLTGNIRKAGSLFLHNLGGNLNTAIGVYALTKDTTGWGNTATGGDALYTNTVGNLNTATGSGALFTNNTGNNNTANGAQALYCNTETRTRPMGLGRLP
jgi:hypothetical protein